MVSDDFRALLISTGNSLVLLLLLHDALSGCLQVNNNYFTRYKALKEFNNV